MKQKQRQELNRKSSLPLFCVIGWNALEQTQKIE